MWKYEKFVFKIIMKNGNKKENPKKYKRSYSKSNILRGPNRHNSTETFTALLSSQGRRNLHPL